MKLTTTTAKTTKAAQIKQEAINTGVPLGISKKLISKFINKLPIP